MVEIPVEAFVVRRAVHTVLRTDHVSHLEGVTYFTWKYTPFERMVKLSAVVHKFLCWGMTFGHQDGASCLLRPPQTIAEVRKMLFSLLDGWAPPFDEALDWLQ